MGVVVLTISLKTVWGWYVESLAENKLLETQITINQGNFDRVTNLLVEEKITSNAAKVALHTLMNEVPDVIYTKKLSPEIQRVLDTFHSSLISPD